VAFYPKHHTSNNNSKKSKSPEVKLHFLSFKVGGAKGNNAQGPTREVGLFYGGRGFLKNFMEISSFLTVNGGISYIA
jgi:hypothetical protein